MGDAAGDRVGCGQRAALLLPASACSGGTVLERSTLDGISQRRNFLTTTAFRRPSPSVPTRIVTVLLLLMALGDACSAQEVRLSVRDSLSRVPVPRVLVTARDNENTVQVHGLTNDLGQLVLRLPSAGRWTLSMRRIGLEPRTRVVETVQTNDAVSVDVLMRPAGFRLPATRVVSVSGSCTRASGSHDRTSALWERVTLALQASVTAERDRADATTLRAVGYDRELNRALLVVSETPVQIRRGIGRPFAALHPDSLATHGYIRSEADQNLQYFAPDATALLSPAFERTHCFDTPARDANPSFAELRFRPAPAQRSPDIEGTAFVEVKSGALRRITFHYVNADSLFPAGSLHAGGEVEFDHRPDGEWIVSAWSIRMPRMVRVTWSRGPRLTGYHEVGGVVDTLVAGATAAEDRLMTRVVTAPVTPQNSELPATSRRRSPGPSDKIVVGGRQIIEFPRPGLRSPDWRLAFQERRRLGPGVFLDSTAFALVTSGTALEVVQQVESIRFLIVPDSVPTPPRDADPDLAEGWIAGALLPVMMPVGAQSGMGQCTVKLFLDGERSTASALRRVAGSTIGGLEFFASPRDVPDGFRRSGNTCGTVVLWSQEQRTAQP